MGFAPWLWVAGLLGRKTSVSPSSRETSLIRSDTRALIHVANAIERMLESETQRESEPSALGVDLLQGLTSAENRLANTIVDATSDDVGVVEIDLQVVRPTMHSMVVVSVLAHGSVQRAVRIATYG